MKRGEKKRKNEGFWWRREGRESVCLRLGRSRVRMRMWMWCVS